MSASLVPFHRCDVTEDEIAAVGDVLRSGWLTTGSIASAFEREFCDYVGCRHALAVNSCTAALHIALVAHGVGLGDEVITTPLTFCSTVSVIQHVGATPVLADVCPHTGNIAPEAIERRLTPATKAVIPVHYAGLPCDMEAIAALCRAHGVILIEDAAHAVGARIGSAHVGSTHTGAFSFYATKNLSTGEGGMLTSDDADFIAHCRMLSLHGMSRNAWKRYASTTSWFYAVEHAGFKYNMPDLMAALGRQQLARLDERNEKRRMIAGRYIDAFAACEQLEPFQFDIPSHMTHARHLFPITLRLESLAIDRDPFIEQLHGAGIGVSVHFIPIHLHPHFAKTYDWRQGDFPNAERLFERLISLPMFPSLRHEEVDRVIASVIGLVEKYQR